MSTTSSRIALIHEQANVDATVEPGVVEGSAVLIAEDSSSAITPTSPPQAGWREAAEQVTAHGEDEPVRSVAFAEEDHA